MLPLDDENKNTGHMMAETTVSRGTVGGAASEAGVLEAVEELKEDVELGGAIDAAGFTDDASLNAIGPPVALDSSVYSDYYDSFGAFPYISFC
jgi:hypothetical protein